MNRVQGIGDRSEVGSIRYWSASKKTVAIYLSKERYDMQVLNLQIIGDGKTFPLIFTVKLMTLFIVSDFFLFLQR